MLDLALVEMAAGLDHLEPAQLTQGFRSAADGDLDRVVDALGRGAGDFDDPVDVIVGHAILPEVSHAVPNAAPIENSSCRAVSV